MSGILRCEFGKDAAKPGGRAIFNRQEIESLAINKWAIDPGEISLGVGDFTNH